MANFVFVLTRGLEDPTRVTRCLQLAKVAKEEGHEVLLFLTDDGVMIAKKGMAENIVCPTGDDANSHLEFLTRNQVPISVCTPCAVARQLEARDFIENAKLDTAKALIRLATEGQVLTF